METICRQSPTLKFSPPPHFVHDWLPHPVWPFGPFKLRKIQQITFEHARLLWIFVLSHKKIIIENTFFLDVKHINNTDIEAKYMYITFKCKTIDLVWNLLNSVTLCIGTSVHSIYPHTTCTYHFCGKLIEELEVNFQELTWVKISFSITD
jgi:hypothetical protein